MNGTLFFIILTTFSTLSFSQGISSNAFFEERVKNFEEHEKERLETEKERESNRKAFLNEKAMEQKERLQALAEHEAQKRKIKKVKPENTPEYEEYLLQKWNYKNDPDKLADAQRHIEKIRMSKKDHRVRQFEIREFALNDTEKNRIPFSRRSLFPSSGKTSGRGGSSGESRGRGSDFSLDFGGGSSGRNFDPPAFDNNILDNNDIPPPPPPPPPMPSSPMDGEFNDFNSINTPSLMPPPIDNPFSSEPPPPEMD